MYIYIYIYKFLLCVHIVCAYTPNRKRRCKYIHTYVHAHTQTYTHTYINKYIHTYMHACIHTYSNGRENCIKMQQ